MSRSGLKFLAAILSLSIVAVLFAGFGSVRLYYGFIARPAVATA